MAFAARQDCDVADGIDAGSSKLQACATGDRSVSSTRSTGWMTEVREQHAGAVSSRTMWTSEDEGGDGGSSVDEGHGNYFTASASHAARWLQFAGRPLELPAVAAEGP